MNRIDTLFEKKPSGILSVYMTAGYPELNDTTTLLNELSAKGADLIEIGMPFSDPLADGPLLQECNQKALDNGMSLEILFEQITNIRETVDIPLILMGYLNPVLNYGFEKFCQKAAETGIDGLILPDLPSDEYSVKYSGICEKYGLYMIFLITPQTSDERIREISGLSRGFIYMVSSASTTGAKEGFQQEQLDYFRRISEMDLSLPRLIGFGISSAETFRQAGEFANGAIIGSAFMKSISGEGSLPDKISNFIGKLEL
ncbi:MAG TPA: tryptophan synthase subunit alpha [Bacteroides sp.]|nr:tryptophan synthase subunit alpha [Bacteroides sp.]